MVTAKDLMEQSVEAAELAAELSDVKEDWTTLLVEIGEEIYRDQPGLPKEIREHRAWLRAKEENDVLYQRHVELERRLAAFAVLTQGIVAAGWASQYEREEKLFGRLDSITRNEPEQG